MLFLFDLLCKATAIIVGLLLLVLMLVAFIVIVFVQPMQSVAIVATVGVLFLVVRGVVILGVLD